MGLKQCSRQWRQQDLAQEAVENRLQALSEYLAVYRASYASSGDGRQYARIRVMRNDIARLRAWWWYLAAVQRSAGWLPMFHRLVEALAMFVAPVRGSRKRRHHSPMMRHVNSYSLIERAYAALEEDVQGQLLTLRLVQRQRPTDSRSREIALLEKRLQAVALLRSSGLPEARRLTVICHLLHWVLTLRQWLGLQLPMTNTVDR